MLYITSALAVLGLASLASAHMKILTPVPYGNSTLNNGPLLADGSDFPCKQRTGVYAAEGASNTMALGSSQTLEFLGSAVHGGGSCQISITYDQAPTKASTFKVIHSIEGGCPMKGIDGNNGDDAGAIDPDTYTFTVPTTLPTGTATLAWTWFNKIGNREMYMNCAPVTLTATAAKRSEDFNNATQLVSRDQSAYNALPNMFTANIGNGCTSIDSADLKFPDPGESLDQFGTQTATPVAPTGTGCAAAVAASAPASSATPSVVSSASPVASSALASSAGTFSTSQPGVSIVPVTSSAAASTPTPVASSPTPVASTSAPVASTPAPVESTTAPAASTPAPVATSAAPAPPASSGTSGTAGALSGPCTSEGNWNCIGGTSYQRCASGAWSPVQPLAPGTSCTVGESANIDIVKREEHHHNGTRHDHTGTRTHTGTHTHTGLITRTRTHSPTYTIPSAAVAAHATRVHPRNFLEKRL